MPTTAETFGITRGKTHESKPINVLYPGLQDNGDVDNTPMTKAEREEMAQLREMVHQQAAAALVTVRTPQPQIQVQAAAISKVFMGALAAITLLSGAGAFVGNSGLFMGGKLQQQEYLIQRVQAAESETAALRTKLDRLRDLYMIRFSEDPDKVDTESMRRKKENK